MMTDLIKFLDTETKQEVWEAFNENRFKWLGDYGFITWLKLVRNGQLWVYLNNLYIMPEHRNKVNLCELRRFFRSKYPKAIFYWHRDKDGYHYSR